DSQFMTAQVLQVVTEPARGAPDAPPRYLLRAWENAYAATEDKTIQADRITYDSAKDLFFAYGEDGREVQIAPQEQIGLAGSQLRGRAAWYDHKTGAAQVVEPANIAFVDTHTGVRPQPVPPAALDVPPMKPKRQNFRNPRVNIERKDFNGR